MFKLYFGIRLLKVSHFGTRSKRNEGGKKIFLIKKTMTKKLKKNCENNVSSKTEYWMKDKKLQKGTTNENFGVGNYNNGN